ncbi:hypothetical protein COLO4_16245 [Corchorus olitorius]|uniref:Exonuclease n=1 Tax=Corchorus olitorius TaxID=93759 RepID=A0A1R3JIG4_9ROSI|nr:hypothetical protein COLO4_16245 [Corchorus olitorius]
MEEKLETADKIVLVQIVKLIQKRGLEGTKGEWKDFLKAHDKKFGASKSDPSRRTKDDLGWIVTKLSKDSQRMMRSSAMLAVDCEMVLCEDGTEALVKVCVVDRDLQVKINEYVNPYKTVADYRTEITGIDAEKLEGVTRSMADIQSVLGYEVRKPGAAHNCLDDACAAMKLVLAKLERGDIPLVQDPSKKAQGRHYAAFAVFNSAEEANRAFENTEGTEEQCQVPSKKREFQSEEKFSESKKHKTDEKPGEETTMANFNQVDDDRLKEIGRLKQEVEQKGSQIVAKDKIIAEREKEIKNLKKKLDKMEVIREVCNHGR